MKTASKPRYRSPTRERYVDISLDEFDDDELRAECANRGISMYSDGSSDSVDEFSGWAVSPADMSRFATLALCGQRKFAEEELLQMFRDRLAELKGAA